MPDVEISNMNMTVSIDIPLTPKDNTFIQTELRTEHGLGEGALTIGYKRNLSNSSWFEVG